VLIRWPYADHHAAAEAKQPVGLALFALSATFAPAIGPTIGGYLTENWLAVHLLRQSRRPRGADDRHVVVLARAKPMKLALLRRGRLAVSSPMAIGLSALQTVLEEGNKDDWFGSVSLSG